ncbi:hypothetical protein J7337_009380 [Fusarium musae]|uniref:Uncharacterized protein n=1 Tax=Fusarium musae TaxID=1042133 RepID=A0A9P8DAV6_9HYPO|nr:hypothetical protein J7337_009380 [Fusarium musae]KAG9498572.1 hypothetical protein J7337_009380 [Fusarium musae]
MCEFNDEDISYDPNPFSTVPPPSGPPRSLGSLGSSGSSESSEPQDSITANPLPERFWEAEAGPRPEHGDSQKRKHAKGEPEELENSPPAKRLQPEQHSITTRVKTPLAREARSDSSSPLQSWDPDLDMPGPSARTERPSTPPRYSSPSFRPTPRPVRDISKSTHTRISQQSTEEQDLPPGIEHGQDEQGIPNQGVSGPSREPKNVPIPLDPLEQYGRALLLTLEKVPEKDREQLVQLVPARLRGQGSCKADRDSMMKMDIAALLSKKLFPKMVGNFHQVGLMARQWLKYSGYVNPNKMFQILEEEIKPTKKQGIELAELWRRACDRKLRHVTDTDRPCGLSEILEMGDTYI